MSTIRLRRHGRRLRPGRPGPFSLPLAGLATAAAALVIGTSSAGAAAGACPSSNPPNTLRLVAGSGQTAQLGKTFQTNLQVELANTNGCPLTGNLAGVSVTFDAPGGGASGIFAASGSDDATVGTDVNGVATAPPFTANYTAGSYSVDAHSDYGTVELYLSNTATGLAASIAASGASSQEATVNSQYAQPLQAQVLDANGKPVQGATVTFAIATGPTGASATFLGGGAQTTATTRSDGLATSPPLVANSSPGHFSAAASTTDLATAATFSLTNHAAANTLTATAPVGQTATVAHQYALPLRARVLDASGQPIEGASVTFTLPAAASSAGASFPGGSNQASALTDASGQASSPPLTANTTAGRFTATAAVAGVATTLSYPLENLAGKPATITPGAADGETTPAGTRFPIRLAVTVKDANSNPVAGATITFTAPAHGASGRFAAHLPLRNQTAKDGKQPTPGQGRRTVRVKTNANGIAIATAFTANDTPGGYVVTANADGHRVGFALINNPRR
jgi:protocatechuate 3,4-dioxygenase beta subunit